MRTKVLLLCFGLLLVSVSAAPKADGRHTTDSGQATVATPDHTDTVNSTTTTTTTTNNTNTNNSSNNASTTPEVSNNATATTSTNTTQAANADDPNDTTATDGSSTEGSQDDDKLPEGMSESLADFVMDMLKGQFHNATKKTQGTPAPSNTTTATLPPSNSTVNGSMASNATTEAEGSAVTEGGEGRNITTSHSSTEKEEEDKSTWGDDGWSSTEYFPSSTKEPFSKNGKANCNAEVDLNNYCIVDDLVNVYFHDDLTARGLRAPIFNMDIVEKLKSCPRGEWCLENDLDVFREMQKRFYQGPLCEESMWECIFDIMVQREKCPDKEFMFVVDSADLMCELFQKEPKEENERRCFAHALAALHVTYADFLAGNMSSVKPETDATCEGYGYRMTKTYLCADSSCDDLFESRIAMEKFGRWSWFMDKVESRVIKCDLSDKDTCGALKDKPTTPRTWFGMTSESYWPTYTTSTSGFFSDDYPEANGNSGGSVGLENSAEGEDESLMMALSVASAVGLLFMVLGLIFWRRSRRRNLLYYRGDGYGKLSADEGPLLPKSSD